MAGEQQQTGERHETGVDAWFKAWAARDFTALAAMYHPDAQYERPDGACRGVGEIVAYLRAVAAAAPQATATVEAAHFSREAVIVEWTERQPGGRESDRVVDVFRVQNGRIVSQRQYLDPGRRLRLLAAFAARIDPNTDSRSGQTIVPLNAGGGDPAATIVAAANGETATDGGTGPALLVDTGPDRGILFAIAEGTFTIGRALDNRLVFRDPATSLHHAQIQSRPGELLVVDLESTNGTLVNGEVVLQRRLKSGDRLGIGQNGLRVILPPASLDGG